jgi:SprT protein
METQPTKVDLLDAVARVKARLYGSSSKGTSTDDQQIREWVRYACERNGCPELYPIIHVEWNTRFTRRLGDGLWSPTRLAGRIRLSIPLWGRASEQDRRETVIHEACHVIVEYKYGRVAPHGSEWRGAMLNCGVEPLRTHTVDRMGLVRRQRLFILCDCPKEAKCRIRIRHFNLIQRGAEMSCKNCGLKLDREVVMEEEGDGAGGMATL